MSLNRKQMLLELGKRILQIRKKKGITLDSLSGEVGVSKGNLSDIENGKRDSRYSTLRLIAHGLKVNFSQLVRGL